MKLIGGIDTAVGEWAGKMMGKPIIEPFAAFGIAHGDRLVGAAIFNDFQGPNANIELTYIGPGTITRSVIRGLATYAFAQNKVSRVTCKTMRRNAVARKLLPRLGFKFEGTLKRYWGTASGDDALIYYMDRTAAKRWLAGA